LAISTAWVTPCGTATFVCQISMSAMSMEFGSLTMRLSRPGWSTTDISTVMPRSWLAWRAISAMVE
jgi:hypothetical protein